MSEFFFSADHRQHEIDKMLERNLSRERLFVLLLGPSATGKSTIINTVNYYTEDKSFEYVKPFMTRQNRTDEVDKISISNFEFDAMNEEGDFVVVNKLYGVRYGTPLKGILEPLENGNIPILDYPLETVNALQRPEYDMLNVYVYPPSIDSWRRRVEAGARNSGGRLEAGVQELGMLAALGCMHENVDVSIVNEDNAPGVAAQDILSVIKRVAL